MQIFCKVNGLDELRAALDGNARQIEYAASRALNATAKVVADAMPAEIERSIDRPTSFTKRGVRVLRYANKRALSATVGFMTAQARYMALQVEGGIRPAGPHGIKLPGNIQLNSFGNIPRGVIAQLKAAAKNGDLSRAIARRIGAGGNRRKGAAPVQLFLGKPRGKGWENAPIGIWRRIPGDPGKLVPVIMFEDKPARYKQKLDFYGKAGAIIGREWDQQFAAALADALRTAR